jgi:hypothetical protein
MNTSKSALTCWHLEFAKVIGCEKCSSSKLLRDTGENVPQPGYIGVDYEQTGLLLVGKNPALPGPLKTQDRVYTAALRALRNEPSPKRYDELRMVLEDFIPQWPFAKYFPLKDPDLNLTDIAFFNLVRCRTKENPSKIIADTCLHTHLEPWLKMLKPTAVLFLLKWAHDQGGREVCEEQKIHCEFVNGRGVSAAEFKKILAKIAQFARERVRQSV